MDNNEDILNDRADANDPANVRLAADLRRLAEAIDAKAYPGRAWPVRRRTVLRIYWLPLAAAAAILLLALLLNPTQAPVNTAPPGRVAVLPNPQAQVDQNEDDWDVPADITPSLADLVQPNLAGQLDLGIPSIPSTSMPSLGDSSFTWSVPQMDLVPEIDLDRNVPAEDSQTQTNVKEEKA